MVDGNTYDSRKMEVEELKEKIIEFFKGPNRYDVTLSFLLEKLNSDIKDLDLLEFCLGELVEEGWVKKSKSLDHYEYDPGEKLNFGGLEG